MKKSIFVLLAIAFYIKFADAQWQPTGGPFGGNVNSMMVAGNKIFAERFPVGFMYQQITAQTGPRLIQA
jgi:hypothetical protein